MLALPKHPRTLVEALVVAVGVLLRKMEVLVLRRVDTWARLVGRR